MREIPSWKQPSVVRRYPLNDTTTAGSSGSHPRRAPTELEDGLRAIFESVGLSIPNPVEDISRASGSIRFIYMCSSLGAVYIPMLSTHIQKLHGVIASEAAARAKAEAALAEERARHARILQDIQTECREPFVVPALLDAFLSVSHIVESIPDSPGESSRR